MTQTVLLVGDVFFFDFGFVVFIVIRMSRRHLSSSSRYRGLLFGLAARSAWRSSTRLSRVSCARTSSAICWRRFGVGPPALSGAGCLAFRVEAFFFLVRAHSVPSSSSSWGQPGQRRACQICSAAETPSVLRVALSRGKAPVVVVDRGLPRRLGFEEEFAVPRSDRARTSAAEDRRFRTPVIPRNLTAELASAGGTRPPSTHWHRSATFCWEDRDAVFDGSR